MPLKNSPLRAATSSPLIRWRIAAPPCSTVDIGVIRNDTQAVVGSKASIRAKNETDVFALSDWIVNSNAIAAGAGLAGLGGGIMVYTVGGKFSSNYSSNSCSTSALSGNGSSVLSFVDSTVNTFTGQMTTNDPSPPAFNPSTAVDSTAHTIDLGADRDKGLRMAH